MERRNEQSKEFSVVHQEIITGIVVLSIEIAGAEAFTEILKSRNGDIPNPVPSFLAQQGLSRADDGDIYTLTHTHTDEGASYEAWFYLQESAITYSWNGNETDRMFSKTTKNHAEEQKTSCTTNELSDLYDFILTEAGVTDELFTKSARNISTLSSLMELVTTGRTEIYTPLTLKGEDIVINMCRENDVPSELKISLDVGRDMQEEISIEFPKQIDDGTFIVTYRPPRGSSPGTFSESESLFLRAMVDMSEEEEYGLTTPTPDKLKEILKKLAKFSGTI